MKKEDRREIIESLEIRLRHLRNDFDLTKAQFDNTSGKNLEMLLEIKGKNRQLLKLQKRLEKTIRQLDVELEKKNRIESELRESEERYRKYISNALDGVFVTDSKCKYIEVNDAASRITGYSLEELQNMSITDIVAAEAQQDHLRLFHTLLETGTSSGEVLFQRKNGEKYYMAVESVKLSDDRYIGFCKDVSDRKQFEEERIKAAKLESIDLLAGGIAHDFNNILTGIMGNISLAKLVAESEKSAEISNMLSLAEKASLRAKDLTQQLLTFSKGTTLAKKAISIKDLVAETAVFALRGANISCDFSLPVETWSVEADEGQINQIINNLVINAKQAMPEGGTIKIGLENVTVGSDDVLPLGEGNYVKIAIEDEGIGIPEESLIKIFDPYYTTKEKGSGLGLATSYSIVKMHGGHISVKSEQNVGTTFYIYLPASFGHVKEKEDVGNQAVGACGKILVMDDEEIILDIASRMLKYIGHDVEVAFDGSEAFLRYRLAKESGKEFNVIILDLTVPGGMGGREVLKKLLELDPEVRAVISSGYSNDPVVLNYKKYGFRGAVSKPYEIEELKNVIQNLLVP